MPQSPSITYWNRLEPRPRSPEISDMLAATVRDPAWMLARQAQFGAFRGEDTGSPSSVQLAASAAPIVGWRPEGESGGRPIDPTKPLEAVIEAEPATPDLATSVELGQTFETLLAQAFGGSAPQDVLDGFRLAYPLPARPPSIRVRLLFSVAWDFTSDPLPTAGVVAQSLVAAFATRGIELSASTTVVETVPGSEWLLTDPVDGRLYSGVRDNTELEIHVAAMPDSDARAFLVVCAGRATDGVALRAALRAGDVPKPLQEAASTGDRDSIQAALDAFVVWVDDVFGDLGSTPAPAWRSDRLEHAAEVVITLPDGKLGVLGSAEGQSGDLDWHSFDLRSMHQTVSGVSAGSVSTSTTTVLPANVRFRGMPNARWWEFEANTTDFGDVRPDKRDLAKLIVLDFMLVHGNDWFVIPFEQAIGTICAVDLLLVHDVFGGATLVERADIGATAAADRWTMFSTSIENPGATGRPVADFFMLPSTAATTTLTGPILEEAKFVRDEMSNVVWAIERVIENGIGQPWFGLERSDAIRAASTEGAMVRKSGSGTTLDGVPLQYLIQTPVPDSWVPFVPVSIDPNRGDIALERAVIYNDWGQQVVPNGRIVSTMTRLREEEVPRAGARVLRRMNRTRWTDGSTFVWGGRRRVEAEGEPSIGLRFDLALPHD